LKRISRKTFKFPQSEQGTSEEKPAAIQGARSGCFTGPGLVKQRKLSTDTEEDHSRGEHRMNRPLQKLYAKFQDLQSSEEGQDLVEYALLLTLISLALIGSVTGIASSIGNVFTSISGTLA
jgi:pilus assembly protein Flp/PilA